MSICTVPKCKTDIWLVSHKDQSEDLPESFLVCNEHLQKDNRFQKIHKSLVLGRFHRQRGDKVNYDGWTLEKKIETWGRSYSPECSKCEKTDRLWKSQPYWVSDPNDCYPYGYMETKYICDGHLNRKKSLRLHSAPTLDELYNRKKSSKLPKAYTPDERTWIEESKAEESSLKKRKVESSE